MVEERPDACFAGIEAAEVERVIGSLEREILVCAGEITFRAGKGNEVF